MNACSLRRLAPLAVATILLGQAPESVLRPPVDERSGMQSEPHADDGSGAGAGRWRTAA